MQARQRPGQQPSSCPPCPRDGCVYPPPPPPPRVLLLLLHGQPLLLLLPRPAPQARTRRLARRPLCVVVRVGVGVGGGGGRCVIGDRWGHTISLSTHAGMGGGGRSCLDRFTTFLPLSELERFALSHTPLSRLSAMPGPGTLCTPCGLFFWLLRPSLTLGTLPSSVPEEALGGAFSRPGQPQQIRHRG